MVRALAYFLNVKKYALLYLAYIFLLVKIYAWQLQKVLNLWGKNVSYID